MTIRGSYDRNQGKSALHVISAWSSEQHLVLAQMKVEDKSNEITAIPALLELLDITGSIITIDAMGTQIEIAKKIIGILPIMSWRLKLIIPFFTLKSVNGLKLLKPIIF